MDVGVFGLTNWWIIPRLHQTGTAGVQLQQQDAVRSVCLVNVYIAIDRTRGLIIPLNHSLVGTSSTLWTLYRINRYSELSEPAHRTRPGNGNKAEIA